MEQIQQPFELTSPFQPTGDQPQAIAAVCSVAPFKNMGQVARRDAAAVVRDGEADKARRIRRPEGDPAVARVLVGVDG